MFNADNDDDSDCEIVENDVAIVCIPDNSDDETEIAKSVPPTLKQKSTPDLNLPIDHSLSSPFQPKLNVPSDNRTAPKRATNVCFTTTASREHVENYENVFQPILAANVAQKDLIVTQKSRAFGMSHNAASNAKIAVNKPQPTHSQENLQQSVSNMNEVFKVRFADNATNSNNNNVPSQHVSKTNSQQIADPRLRKAFQTSATQVTPNSMNDVFKPKLASTATPNAYTKKIDLSVKPVHVAPPTTNSYQNILRLPNLNNDSNNNKTTHLTDYQNVFKPRLADEKNMQDRDTNHAVTIRPIASLATKNQDVFKPRLQMDANTKSAPASSQNNTPLMDHTQNVFSVRLANDNNKAAVGAQIKFLNSSKFSQVAPAQNVATKAHAATRTAPAIVDLCDSSPESSPELQSIFKPKLAENTSTSVPKLPTRNIINICSSPEEEMMTSHFNKSKRYARNDKRRLSNKLQSFNSTFRCNASNDNNTLTVDLSSSPEPEILPKPNNNNKIGNTKTKVDYENPFQIRLADNQEQNNKILPQKCRSGDNSMQENAPNTQTNTMSSQSGDFNYETAFQVRLAATDDQKSNDCPKAASATNYSDAFKPRLASCKPQQHVSSAAKVINTQKQQQTTSNFTKTPASETENIIDVFKPRLNSDLASCNKTPAWEPQTLSLCSRQNTNSYENVFQPRLAIADNKSGNQATHNLTQVAAPAVVTTPAPKLLSAPPNKMPKNRDILEPYKNVFVPKLAVPANNEELGESIVTSSSDSNMTGVDSSSGNNVKNLHCDVTLATFENNDNCAVWDAEESNDSNCLTIDETRFEASEAEQLGNIEVSNDHCSNTLPDSKIQGLNESANECTEAVVIDVETTSNDVNNEFENAAQKLQNAVKLTDPDVEQQTENDKNVIGFAAEQEEAVAISIASRIVNEIIDDAHANVTSNCSDVICSSPKQLSELGKTQNQYPYATKLANSSFKNIFHVPLVAEKTDVTTTPLTQKENVEQHNYQDDVMQTDKELPLVGGECLMDVAQTNTTQRGSLSIEEKNHEEETTVPISTEGAEEATEKPGNSSYTDASLSNTDDKVAVSMQTKTAVKEISKNDGSHSRMMLELTNHSKILFDDVFQVPLAAPNNSAALKSDEVKSSSTLDSCSVGGGDGEAAVNTQSSTADSETLKDAGTTNKSFLETANHSKVLYENVFQIPLAGNNDSPAKNADDRAVENVTQHDEIMQPRMVLKNDGSDNDPNAHADVFIIDSDVEEGELQDMDDLNDSSIQIIDDNSDNEDTSKVETIGDEQIELQTAPIFEVVFSQKHYFDKLSSKIVETLTEALNAPTTETSERYKLVLQNNELCVQAFELQPKVTVESAIETKANKENVVEAQTDAPITVAKGSSPAAADVESSSEDHDLSLLFTIDTSPTKRIDAGQVPSYKKAIRDPLNDECTPSKRAKVDDADVCVRPRAQRSCFNCGSTEHSMRECTKRRNMKRIQKAKQKHQSKQERYHMDTEQRFAHLRPGKLSNQLRSALGLERGEMPSFFYRMRVFGYPPGWLEDSKIDSSGLALFVDKDKEVPAANLDEGEVNDQVKYDIRKIIDFPGFNSDPGDNFYDDFKYHCVPPMHPTHTKEEFIKMLGDNVYQGYKQKKLKELPTSENAEWTEMQSASIVLEEDMEIVEGEIGYIETERPPPPTGSPPDDEVPPPPPPFYLTADDETPPPPPPFNVAENETPAESKSNPADGSYVSTASDNADEQITERAESPTLADLEAQQERLRNELETGDTNSSNVENEKESMSLDNQELRKNTENGNGDNENSESNEETNEKLNDNNQMNTNLKEGNLLGDNDGAICSMPVTPLTPATPSDRVVCESYVGTPLCKFSPYDKLPKGDNFKVGVSDVINFENLPDSTGKYEKMKDVLKKVRNIVNEMHKREDD